MERCRLSGSNSEYDSDPLFSNFRSQRAHRDSPLQDYREQQAENEYHRYDNYRNQQPEREYHRSYRYHNQNSGYDDYGSRPFVESRPGASSEYSDSNYGGPVASASPSYNESDFLDLVRQMMSIDPVRKVIQDDHHDVYVKLMNRLLD